MFRFIDLFAGIGGFRLGLEAVGGVCVGSSEINRAARETYRQNWPQDTPEMELGDITKVVDLPEHDVLVGGVPCQPWSVAGKMLGFEDARGRLWFDVQRLVLMHKPKAFVFENVRGLADPRNRHNLNELLERLGGGDFCVQWRLLNSYDFGLPQNRQRVFIVGVRRDVTGRFEFPEPVGIHPALADFLDGIEVRATGDRRRLTPENLGGRQAVIYGNAFQQSGEINDFFTLCDTRHGHTTIHSWDLLETTPEEKEVCLAILRNRRKKAHGERDGNPIRIDKLLLMSPSASLARVKKLEEMGILRYAGEDHVELVNSKNSSGIGGLYRVYLPQTKVFSTLTATGTRDLVATRTIAYADPEEFREAFVNEIYRPGNYRRLSTREQARLQGFPDSFLPHANPARAETQFGNAVSVPVIVALAQNLLAALQSEERQLVSRA